MFRALMGGLKVENVMVSIDEKPVNRRIIGQSIKTSKVENMNLMFYDLKSIKTLDLSNFNTSSVKDMG